MKFDLWNQPNQFSLIVPETWGADELDGLTEFVPERGDAAINVTFLRKMSNIASMDRDVQLIVEQFAAKNGLLPRGELALQSFSAWWRCFGEYGSGNDKKMPNYWFLCSVAGQSGAAMASLCCDDVQSRSYIEGVEMLKGLKYLKKD